jgi:hypothetical protein
MKEVLQRREEMNNKQRGAFARHQNGAKKCELP